MRENAQARQRARLFFALWPDKRVRRELAAVAQGAHALFGGRLMHAETLHLTLLFIGDVPRVQIEAAKQAAATVAAEAFSLQLLPLRSWKHNRIAYAAPQEEVPALLNLASALREAMSQAGVPYDRKAFAAHVTLLRNITRSVEAGPIGPVNWTVDEFALVESVPGLEGVHYQVLASWPLG